MKKRIILGSASPRRKELLEQIGIKFEVVVSDAEEHYESTRPDEIVKELALMKAEQVAEEVKRREKEGVGEDYLLRSETGEARLRNLLILGADTVVVRDGEILGKPSGADQAFEMLKSLQGRAHQVYTGVAVLDFDGNAERHTVSHKAGAYGVQGRFAAYIDRIEGDYYNVVGLPVAYLYHAVKGRLEE